MICKKCSLDKPQTAEFFRQYIKNGKVYWDKSCRACVRAESAEKRRTLYRTDPTFSSSVKSQAKLYRARHRHQLLEAKRAAYIALTGDPTKLDEYRTKQRERARKYYKTDAYRAKQRARRKLMRQNIAFRIRESISRRINHSLLKSGDSCIKHLPFTVQELKQHLERQFSEGMSWENYGYNGWHIDHIRPVSSFNIRSMTDPDFKICWGLDNLQPLWAKDNFTKGSRVTPLKR